MTDQFSKKKSQWCWKSIHLLSVKKKWLVRRVIGIDMLRLILKPESCSLLQHS